MENEVMAGAEIAANHGLNLKKVLGIVAVGGAVVVTGWLINKAVKAIKKNQETKLLTNGDIQAESTEESK